jgi:hypothetical protein
VRCASSSSADRCGRDDAGEQRDVGDRGPRLAQGNETHDRRVDLRHRTERSGRNGEQPCDPEKRLQHHREASVLRRRRQSRHPIDHLLLQHHVDIGEQGIVLREVETEWRADVVRKVADDAQIPEPSVAKSKSSASATCSVNSFGRELGSKPCGEIAVDLDGVHVAGALDQRPRERREARADLDERLARMRLDRIDDAPDVMSVGEEVLAEALSGLVALHRAGRFPRETRASERRARTEASARSRPSRA